MIKVAAPPIAQVVASSPLELRTLASTGPESELLEGRLWPGMRVAILGGPLDASGYRWYRVQVGGLIGWTAAASLDGEVWLASVHNGRIAFGAYAPAGAGVEILATAMDGWDVRQLAVIPRADLIGTSSGRGIVPALQCADGLTPAWSPTGQWLSLVVAPDCSGVIFIVGADGTHLRRIDHMERAAWSPDGQTVAFDLETPFCGSWPCGDDLGPWEVLLATLPDGAARAVTHGEEGDAFANPQWSPDGAQIAVSRWQSAPGGEIADETVFLVPTDGGEQRRLTAGSVVGWLPDGSGLVVSRRRADASGEDLYLVSPDGSSEARWTAGRVQFSPDGRWMLGTRWEDGQPTATLTRNDATERITLPTGWEVHSWSADGQKLLFSADIPSDGWRSLYALDLTSGEVRELNAFPPGELATFGGFVVEPVLAYDLN